MMPSPTVLFVDTRRPLSLITRGLFNRCGFVLVEHRSLVQAAPTLEHGWLPEFVVVDVRERSSHFHESTARALCDFVERHLSDLAHTTHLVMLTSEPMSASAATRCLGLGIHVLCAPLMPYRQLARALIDLQGGSSAACCLGASERGVSHTPHR
jgi:hypothetical protein